MGETVDLRSLAAQVAHNCLVADAQRWGHFSLCGLLLRLRELYKREAGLPPWARVETAAVLPWVGEREATWARLEEAAYEPLRLGGTEVDARDEDAVNPMIAPAGWLYVAGHGPGGHPLFVLGEIEGRREAEGVEIHVLGRELVHDLVPVPAMCRPRRVVARRAATLGHLWAAIEEAAGARDHRAGGHPEGCGLRHRRGGKPPFPPGDHSLSRRHARFFHQGGELRHLL